MTSVIGSTSEPSPIPFDSLSAVAVGYVGLSLIGSSSGQIQAPTMNEMMSSSWSQRSSVLALVMSGPVKVEDQVPVVNSPAELLAEIREISGLTWDQLARYFGVSRRAVHLWAAGGRMSAANEELLAHLVRSVAAVRDLEPAARRQALLRPDSGMNIIDTERARHSSRDSDINRSPDIVAATGEA